MMTTALDGRQKRTVTTVTPSVTVTVVTEKELKCDALRSERHSSQTTDFRETQNGMKDKASQFAAPR